MATTRVLDRWATTGAMVKQTRLKLKSASDPSVWRMHPIDMEMGNAARSGLSGRSIWSVGVAGAPPVWFRSDGRSELPGAQLTTYRTKGLLRERKNLEPSAGTETPGKPPSPAMSRPRGGAFVVVRARESRAQGEGRQ